MLGNWLKFAWDANMLALESQRVIAMRLAKLSMGGAGASKEAEREKMFAAGQAGIKMTTGGLGHSVVKQYRRKVRSNLKRLAK